MFVGPNPAYVFTSRGADADLDLFLKTSTSTQFWLQWRLRGMAQEPTLKKMANTEPRRISERNQTFG